MQMGMAGKVGAVLRAGGADAPLGEGREGTHELPGSRSMIESKALMEPKRLVPQTLKTVTSLP